MRHNPTGLVVHLGRFHHPSDHDHEHRWPWSRIHSAPKDLPLCHMQDKALYHSFLNCIFLYRNQWKILEAEQSNFFSNIIACSKNILEPCQPPTTTKWNTGTCCGLKQTSEALQLSVFDASFSAQRTTSSWKRESLYCYRLSDFWGSSLFWERQTCSRPPFLFNMQWNSNRVGT